MSWLKKKIEGFFSILGLLCDKIFEKSPFLFRLASHFFEKTSKITSFLLFHSVGYSFTIFLVGFLTNFYYEQFQSLLLKLELFGFSKFFVILWTFPLGFQLFLLIFLLFLDIVVVNTILASSTKIPQYMKSKHGELIMKELHYNSTISTLLKSVYPVASIFCIVCGNKAIQSYENMKISEDWKEVSKEAIKNGQQPPASPFTIVQYTKGSSTMDLSLSSKNE